MLNAQLKRLKADEQAMKATIGELIVSTEKAERAIAGLKTTVREADETLGEHLQDAERFCIEIKTSTEAGAEVLNRISADRRRPALAAGRGAGAAQARARTRPIRGRIVGGGARRWPNARPRPRAQGRAA